jgi:hypothetical protein
MESHGQELDWGHRLPVHRNAQEHFDEAVDAKV